MQFEWDENKALRNEKKHNVSFREAVTLFDDPLEMTMCDPAHSEGEYRFLSVGRSVNGRLLVVSYTERYDDNIRIISAREATKQEEKQYED
jgi:hypothetical protein